MNKKITNKIVNLQSTRRSFLSNTVKASVLGTAAGAFPHIWMKQGNVYAAKNEI